MYVCTYISPITRIINSLFFYFNVIALSVVAVVVFVVFVRIVKIEKDKVELMPPLIRCSVFFFFASVYL